MKRSSVYSQKLRLKRLLSDKILLQKHLGKLKLCFFERSYPEEIADRQLKTL